MMVDKKLAKPLITSIAHISNVDELKELEVACKDSMAVFKEQFKIVEAKYLEMQGLIRRGRTKVSALQAKIKAFEASKDLEFDTWYKTGKNEWREGCCEYFLANSKTAAGRVRGICIRCDKVNNTRRIPLTIKAVCNPNESDEGPLIGSVYEGEYEFHVYKQTFDASVFQKMSRLATLMLFGTNVDKLFPAMIAQEEERKIGGWSSDTAYGMQDGQLLIIERKWQNG